MACLARKSVRTVHWLFQGSARVARRVVRVGAGQSAPVVRCVRAGGHTMQAVRKALINFLIHEFDRKVRAPLTLSPLHARPHPAFNPCQRLGASPRP